MIKRPGYPHDKALLAAALAYACRYLRHSYDHIMRGRLQTPVATFWTGTVGLIPAGFAVYLAHRRKEWAPFFAVVAGFWTAVGALAVHLPPHWSPLSEIWRGGLDWFDGGSLAMMVGGSLWFGIAGLVSMRGSVAAGSWVSETLGPTPVVRR